MLDVCARVADEDMYFMFMLVLMLISESQP